MAQPKLPKNNIDVIILAGGQGQRLRTVIPDKPKVLAEVSGRPFLDLVLEKLFSAGFERIILSVGYLKDQIKKYVEENHPDRQIKFSEEDFPLGTGGAIKKALTLVRSNPFLVVNGDSITSIDFDKFLDFHEEKGGLISMAVALPRAEKDYGALSLDPSDKIVSYNEKAKAGGTLLNAGLYLISQKAISYFPPQEIFSIEEDFFPKVINQSYGFPCEGDVIDIGTPERLKKARTIIRND